MTPCFVYRYYTNRIFMGACCVGAEVLYLAAHAATDPRIANIAGPLAQVLPASVHLPTPALLGWDLSRCGDWCVYLVLASNIAANFRS